MKLKSLLLSSIWLLLFAENNNAQVNLIPNPSFEATIVLNVYSGQGCITDWKNLDSNSYTTCRFIYFSTFVLTSNSFTLPSNYWFYQHARHGDGVIDLTVYNPLFPLGASTIRGTARTKLKTQLIAGQKYCAKMYVSPFEEETYFTNGIGMYFDNGQLDTIVAQDSSGIYPFVNPQVQCGFIINDTLNWKPVEGTFIANGTETFLTLGNFLSDTNTQKEICNAAEPCHCSDIIIDDVSLIPTDISNWLHDVSCILGDSVYVGLREYEYPDGMWYDINMNFIKMGSGFKVKPTQWATKYIMQIDLCGTIRSDTLTVWAAPDEVSDVNAKRDIEVFPNPAKNVIEIKCMMTTAGSTKVEMYNAVGELVKSIPLSSRRIKIDVFDLPKGVYFLKCEGIIKKVVID
jgi:hypothetical protein